MYLEFFRGAGRFGSEFYRLGKGYEGIIPAHNFADLNIPTGDRKQVLQDRDVQFSCLPPCVGGMGVLNLATGDNAPWRVDYNSIGLAPAKFLRADFLEVKPRGGYVGIGEFVHQVSLDLPLVSHAFGALASIPALSRKWWRSLGESGDCYLASWAKSLRAAHREGVPREPEMNGIS